MRIGNRTVGIFGVRGEYHALLNVCPHRRDRLCEGPQCGTGVDAGDWRVTSGHADELVRCAWHGREFDIRTGRALVDPGMKAKSFPVTVDGDDLYVQA